MKIEDIALNNKYTKWYISIITTAKNRATERNEAKKLLGYVEGHHIIPKCVLKSDEVVYLTNKEHFVCHLLLTKMFTGSVKRKLEYAVTQFSRGGKLKPHQIKIALSFKGKPCCDERKDNISKGRKKTNKVKCQFCSKETDPGNFKLFHGDNCKFNPNIDPRILEERKKLKSDSVKKSMSLGTFKSGNPNSTKPIICPHCGKEGINLPVMKRHHFDRCKHRESSGNLLQT